MQSADMDRYVRQTLLPFWGAQGQEKLRAARVAIIGCGALGSVAANNLARAGVGHLVLCDRDVVELANLHRQMLFDESDAREQLPKAVAATRRLSQINADITVEALVSDLNATNVENLLEGVHLIVDGTDNFETRYVLNDACVKQDKPWVYAGCVATYGAVMPIVPHKTACLRCVFPDLPPIGSGPTCDTAGVLNASAMAVASVQSAEVLKVLLGDHSALLGGMLQIDLWSNSYRRVDVPRQPACRCCAQSAFDYLAGHHELLLTALCGRNAVQVVPVTASELDLGSMRQAWQRLGQVRGNAHLLKMSVADFDITLFRDGRAVFDGTTDPEIAKALYAKYIGH